jgi:hypothetical protein
MVDMGKDFETSCEKVVETLFQGLSRAEFPLYGQ